MPSNWLFYLVKVIPDNNEALYNLFIFRKFISDFSKLTAKSGKLDILHIQLILKEESSLNDDKVLDF